MKKRVGCCEMKFFSFLLVFMLFFSLVSLVSSESSSTQRGNFFDSFRDFFGKHFRGLTGWVVSDDEPALEDEVVSDLDSSDEVEEVIEEIIIPPLPPEPTPEVLENETSDGSDDINDSSDEEPIIGNVSEEFNESLIDNTSIDISNDSTAVDLPSDDTSSDSGEDSKLVILNSSIKSSRVVIGRPVKWVNSVSVEGKGELSVELPLQASDIMVKTGEDARLSKDSIEDYNSVETTEEKVNLVSLTGNVIKSQERGKLTRLFDWLFRGITGNVIYEEALEIEVDSDGLKVNLTDVADSQEIVVEYYTPGPEVREELTENGKKVIIFDDYETGYEDILAYTLLEDELQVSSKDINRLKLYWFNEGSREEVDFDYSDLDSDGMIDYIEWTVPHLSEQEYEIVLSESYENLVDGLIGYWPFDETSVTTARDYSPMGRNGTIFGTVNPNQPGKVGNSFYFNGAAGSRVDVGNYDDLLVGKNQLTMAAWIYPTRFGKNNDYRETIFTNSLDNYFMIEWRLFWGEGSDAGPERLAFSTDPYMTSSEFNFCRGLLSKDTWQHVVCSRNSTHYVCFVDGIKCQHIIPTSGTIQRQRSAINMNIGSRPGDSFYPHSYQGRIDEPAIWNRSLSDDEISQLYNSGEGISLRYHLLPEPPEPLLIFAGGSGTEEDPYQIETCQQLQNITHYLNASYILNNDIDCSETAEWNWNGEYYAGFEPIGFSDPAMESNFTGNLDGQNFTISNLFIHLESNNIGLFSILSRGEIKNLRLIDININGSKTVGGLVGYSMYGDISNSYTSGNVSGYSNVGGLIGSMDYGTVSNSYASGNVNGTFYTGGLVGYSMYGDISNSYTSGNVSGYYTVGGLIGSSGNITVSNSYTSGHVTGDSNVGGLIGFTYNERISNTYYDQNISGQSDTGKGEPRTTEQMKSISNYEGWDFESVWGINPGENGGYPFLGWQGFGHSGLFAGGSGTEEDPYQIETCQQLQNIDFNLTASYILNNDIDCSETATWNLDGGSSRGFKPIGNNDNRTIFESTGNSYGGVEPMGGPPIYSPDSGGVQPIPPTDPIIPIINSEFTGNLDGQNFTISNLFIYRTNTEGVGLFSELYGGEIKNLRLVDININGGNTVGGLVGHVAHGIISNSYTSGHVTGDSRVGGLIGSSGFSISSPYPGTTVSNSGSIASVNGNYFVGGLVGNVDYGTISNSYSTGNVNGVLYIGGLVGKVQNGNISNSYASDVTGVYYTGGLAGIVESIVVSNSYYDQNTSDNQPYAVNGEPRTTEQMKSISNYEGWDIKISDIDVNNGYPYLSWQIGETDSIWKIYYSFDIGSCRTLSEPGVYTLTDDINSDGECLVIASDNVTINGNGFSIEGDINTQGHQNISFYNISFRGNLIASSTNLSLRNVNLLQGASIDVSEEGNVELSYFNSNGEIKMNSSSFNISSDLVLDETLNISKGLISLDENLLFFNEGLNSSAAITFNNAYAGNFPVKFLRMGLGGNICTENCVNSTALTASRASFTVPFLDNNISLGLLPNSSIEIPLHTGWNLIAPSNPSLQKEVQACEEAAQNSPFPTECQYKDVEIPLKKGWNLIGFSSPVKKTVFRDVASVDGLDWNSAAKQKKVQRYVPYYKNDGNVARYEFMGLSGYEDTLDEGKGYWIYSNVNSNLTLKDVVPQTSSTEFSYSSRDLLFRNNTNGEILNMDDLRQIYVTNIHLWNAHRAHFDTRYFDLEYTLNSWDGFFIFVPDVSISAENISVLILN